MSFDQERMTISLAAEISQWAVNQEWWCGGEFTRGSAVSSSQAAQHDDVNIQVLLPCIGAYFHKLSTSTTIKGDSNGSFY